VPNTPASIGEGVLLVLLTRKSTAAKGIPLLGKNAPPGFARLGVGAPWRGKNKDPQRASIAS